MTPSVALIINTAHQSDSLSRVLRGVANQSEQAKDIIIAEDGSDEATRQVVGQWPGSQGAGFQHLTQEKAGFRRSRILNRAITRTSADYVVFLDGDTIPHPDFVRDHRLLARERLFVQGHRVLVLREASAWFGTGEFARDRRRAFFTGQLRGLKHVFRWWTPFKRVLRHLDGVRGCNLGIWRTDLIRVNGYDEGYVGWGCEDLDLALRLIRSDVARLDVRGWAQCYHLWHPPADRSNLAANESRLSRAAQGLEIRCEIGLDQHTSKENSVPPSVPA